VSPHGASQGLKPVNRNWIGAVPAHWDTAQLKLVARLESGHTPSRLVSEYWENCTIPWFTLADVWQLREERRKYVLETSEMVSELGIANSSARLLPAGTVMLSRTASVGFTGIMGRDMATTQDFVNWVCGPKLRPEYLWYCLQAMAPEYDRLRFGSTHHTIYMPDVAQFKVPVPPLHEQERIANFLDEQTAQIDALIAAKESLAGSLKDIEEVTGFDLVTRGMSAVVKRASYSEPWLAEVPAHWQLCKLRYVAKIGNGSTPKRDKDEYWVGGSMPWLNSGAVNTSRIQDASDYVTETARKECHLPIVRRGSTVVALTGQGKTRGTAALIELETTINQHLAYVSPFDSKLTDEFLWVALTGFYSVLRYLSEGEGSTKGALTCEQLNQFRLPLPPLEEQELIVRAYKERTRAIEELLFHVREHLERLREYRSSLISATVTGQLNIPTMQRCHDSELD